MIRTSKNKKTKEIIASKQWVKKGNGSRVIVQKFYMAYYLDLNLSTLLVHLVNNICDLIKCFEKDVNKKLLSHNLTVLRIIKQQN